MKIALLAGHTYAARIELGGLERLAGLETIADKLGEGGFRAVTVWDVDNVPNWFPATLRADGPGVRYGEGTWPGADLSVELPPQVKAIVDITREAPTQAGRGGGGGGLRTVVRLDVRTLPPVFEDDFLLFILGVRLAMFFL